SAYDLSESNLNWVFISYYKSPLIFEKISRTIGQTNFILGLKTFFDDYNKKIALLSDLQDVLENTVNESLDWFFFPWFDNFYLPKYNFLECTYNSSAQILHLTINDLNEPLNDYMYSQQVELQIYNSGGIIYDEWVWINGTTMFNIALTSKPTKVRLKYGDEVIVQLESQYETYLEKSLIEPFIFGYDLCTLLLFCSVPLIYLIFNFSIKKKKKSKI
ncbi:MAG: hypothetical protein ACFFAA_11305, partial [Promethearchaeota archaeon]